MKSKDVQLYVETEPDIYEKLDMFEDEDIMMNFKLKDSQDIARIFSTYTQSFTVPASPKNKQILDWIFFPDLAIDKPRFKKAKIYIKEEIFKLGIFEINASKFTHLKMSSIALTFSTGVGTLKTLIGEDTIGSLGIEEDELFEWTDNYVYQSLMGNTFIKTPFISSARVWTYGDNTSADIKYNGSTPVDYRYVEKEELRPSIPYSAIMDRVIAKYGFDVECNLFESDVYTKLHVWCNSESISNVKYLKAVLTNPFGAYEIDNGDPPPGKTWNISHDNGLFKLIRNPIPQPVAEEKVKLYYAIDPVPVFPINGDIYCDFSVRDLQGKEVFHQRVQVKEPESNIPNPVKAIMEWSVPDSLTNTIGVDAPFEFNIYVRFTNPVSWTVSRVSMEIKNPIGSYTYGKRSINNLSSSYPILPSSINLFMALPNIKIIDFLSSFFKMFNIRVVERTKVAIGFPPMSWIAPPDFIQFIGTKPVEIDYTPYTDVAEFDMGLPTQYKSYSFAHKQPKYIGNIDYKRIHPQNHEYGQLVYFTDNSNLTEEYKLETAYSIMVPTVIRDTIVQTYYGFTDAEKKDSERYGPLEQGKGQYTPAFGDFTLFYYAGEQEVKNTLGTPITFGFRTGSTVSQLKKVVNMNISNSTDVEAYTNSLGFKDELNIVPEQFVCNFNLFSNYYFDLITTITNQNAYIYNFTCYLPADKMRSFSLRKTVIIEERAFYIEEASMNLITGKTTIRALNRAISKFPTVLFDYNPLHYNPNHYSTII